MNNTFINAYEMSLLNQMLDHYRDEVATEDHIHDEYYSSGCIACLKEGILNSIRGYIELTAELSNQDIDF
jgi:hypothetical protein